MLAFDQHRIAKLVGAVTVLDKGCGGALQHRIVSEGAKELEMAFAGLVHPGENCIHDAQPSFTSDASARKAIPRTYAAVGLRGGSSARTTVVPTATMRPPVTAACLIDAAVLSGMR